MPLNTGETNLIRLSPWAIVSVVFGHLTKLVSNAYALIPILYASWKMDFDSKWLIIGASVVFSVSTIMAVVYWLRFHYQVNRDKLIVQQGLLFSKIDEIPLDKILNVRIEQPFYFKPLDLFTLVAETAGSSKDEVQLRALSASVAKELQAALVGNNHASANSAANAIELAHATHAIDSNNTIGSPHATTNMAANEPPLWVHRNGDDLVLFGLYQNNLLWLALILSPILGQFDYDKLSQQVWFQALWGQATRLTHGDLWLEIVLASTLLLAVLGILSLLSVLSAILKYYPYHLRFDGRTLVRTGGVISHQQDALKVHRIQLLQLEQPWLARLLGRWTLRFKQVQGQEVEQQKKGNMLIPSLRTSELATILTSINPSRLPEHALAQLSLPKSYWSVHWLWLAKRMWAPFMPALFSLFAGELWISCALALVGVAFCLFLIIYYCQLGYHIKRSGIWLHTGLLGQQWRFIQYKKIQTVNWHTSPGLRRRGLCTLTLGLASGNVTISCIPVRHANHIYRQTMMATGTDFNNWI
ncbi:hypothetical protein FJQ87_05025 [Shewanella sp. SNU WT4]|uniref:PH domain-containing protein n=1 Tax=Shewanella sp. SNU WT4 TaxID=2590015 RepID=UPI00112C95B4|nr:PH domain-containing protein [Shewanella sp. SNU WT4]QDF66129.1 hypothetical protein FJQ87_05025 [Shewanella sp. SNU WT4]